jgi:hypothetical protein
MTHGTAKSVVEGTFQSTEGLQIFFRCWQPDGPQVATRSDFSALRARAYHKTHIPVQQAQACPYA